MTDPLEYNDKFESLFLSEILTYLSLTDDIQAGVRGVSKSWHKMCQLYKTAWLEALDTKRSAVLLELTSAKGMKMNGNKAQITGGRNPKSHRYPVTMDNWLTGESELMTFKICNLNPFATLRADADAETPNLIQYSTTGKLRKSHGMMLDQMVMLGRFESNAINGNFFRGDQRDFFSLPRNSLVLARLNASMWTWWTVHPKLAGIHSRGSISDLICAAVSDNDISLQVASRDELWPQDGEKGAHLVRNMIRAMRTWADQRVHETFWVSHKFKTGSIMTAYRDGTFGQVYLVKGHSNVIAELCPRLPFCCRATLLPIYDLWTYDGIITASEVRPSPKQACDLEAHVNKAILEKKVSWRGPIAEQWQYPPPPLPRNKDTTGREADMDWSSHEDAHSNPFINTEESEEINAVDVDLGRRIVKAAISKGGIDSSTEWQGQDTLVIRRFGYSYRENPNGIAMLMQRGGSIGLLTFKVDHDRGKDPNDNYIPTYNLREVLGGILEAAMQIRLPNIIQPDELAVVQPLERVLKQCFEEKGAEAPKVVWYTPVSEEEAAFATAFGG